MRNANAPAAATKLEALQDFIPELKDHNLSEFSICVNYYNQVVCADYFYQHLLGSFNKKSQLDNSSNIDEPIVDNVSYHLLEFQRVAKNNIYIITDLQQQIKNQKEDILKLNKQVKEYHQVIAQLRKLYQEQCEANKQLTEQWDSRYSNQQKRIQTIINIVLIERELLYNDIEALIKNNNRFSLENLLNYTLQLWLSQHNPVIVKFIETLTSNNFNTNTKNTEKLFKRAMAIDSLYRSRHEKYVSEVGLMASAIKYSIA
ncbi:hypothetical protein F8M41_008430 [Gigaspora margarita]|uniref:Uncharacterized protein n=1 Tax=Gigaspora margarita TaxID=4874 RepID=A0A8H3X6I4_GIGMA|nr:hypothetical protein F8M41_008430 [Gigaspora margarita]